MTAVSTPPTTNIETEIQRVGEELWNRIRGEVPGIFNKGYWQGKILDWAMADPSFKVDLLRFVDVLPTLQSTEAISRHVSEYLLKEGRELPTLMGAAVKMAAGGWGSGIAANAIRKNVTGMAERFIVGTHAAEALPVLKKLYKEGFAFTVDLLGEATISDAEADAYQRRYLDLIDNLVNEVSTWPADPLLERNHLGAIPRTNVSIKVSAMEPHIDPVDPNGSVERLIKRVLPLFLRAKQRGVFLNVDLEQWSLNRVTYDLFERLIEHPELRDWPHLGIVVQAYLKSSGEDLDRMLALAKRRGAPITIRLVKGAYWDYEVVTSGLHGYPCPVFTDKAATDAQYEKLSETLLENFEHLQPAFGSHNLRSLVHAMTTAKQMKVPPQAYEIQMLYGMAEPERAALRSMGHRVRLYAPVGELLPGMAYLVRRLLENTANSGFLKITHHDGVDIRRVLSEPRPGPEKDRKGRMKRGDLRTPFENAALTDFSYRTQRDSFAAAVERVRKTLPVRVPVVIGGKERPGHKVVDRENPSHTDQVVARVSYATGPDADEAVRIAHAAYPAWRDRPLVERGLLLERLADILERDRFELAAMQAFEVAKPWREADADIAEAIDFCRYYARQALIELGPRPQGSLPGEDNVMWYEGRGVAAIIAPWNFPMAILGGMTTAALVAGCPVIMKPSGQSAAIAYGLFQRMMEAGFPGDVVHFVPGGGRDVGAAMVAHPNVAQIAFTGSKEVGLGIIAEAGRTKEGQEQVKRVICEMGGKNAIIVDEDSDLDEAVAGVMKSAFGFAGQKCSACSRVVVVGSAYEPFIARLTEACRSIAITAGDDPSCMLNPVIDRASYERLKEVAANPGPGAKKLFAGEAPQGGYYLAPTIFEVTDPKHHLMQEEFFGPILTILRAENFERAIDAANDVEFKLTGAVFSRLPSNLEYARRRFRVGNLYLNRGSTGALVHRQPFGGFGMSGIGTKAGGPSYLLFFADPRVVTENTMRRGVTPELSE
jgi:RHH-type proline utilization regulon transcriptional repressor/proline dehydrogenase/delta 1-pyrroline-5-carboxylate dehydrogenase